MTIEGQYLTYAEFQALGGSAIGETPFKILEFEARKEIDKYTYGRLKNLSSQTNEVKLCDYNLINTLQGYDADKTRNKAISSESTDGYSVSYGNGGKDSMVAKESEVKNIIYTYLCECKLDDGTPYLYRGVR